MAASPGRGLLAIMALSLSILSCVRLLWALETRLEPKARRRLFPRQLRSLAVVGLFASCTGFPVVFVQLWHMDARSAGVLCASFPQVFRACRFVAALQETHLALTLLAECMRATKLLRLLNWGIIAIWILGSVLGAVDAIWFPYHYDMKGMCVPVHGDFISIGVIGLCLLTSCIASVATCAKASAGFTTLAVQRRNFKRAVWYPCISMLSYAPIMAVYAFPKLFYTQFVAVAIFFECSNGAMNAGMYAFQSHYASRLSKSTDSNSKAIGDTGVSLPSVSTDASDAHTVDIESVSSFHVQFGGVDVVMLNLSTSSFEKFEEDLPDWVDNRRLAPRLSLSF